MRVLIVEDAIIQGFMLDGWLREWGIDTYIAHDGTEAIAWLKDCHENNIEVDGILLDLLMEPMDGTEFLRKMLNGFVEKIPVIIVTAYAELAKNLKGVCGVIFKSSATLRQDVKEGIDKHFAKKKVDA